MYKIWHNTFTSLFSQILNLTHILILIIYFWTRITSLNLIDMFLRYSMIQLINERIFLWVMQQLYLWLSILFNSMSLSSWIFLIWIYHLTILALNLESWVVETFIDLTGTFDLAITWRNHIFSLWILWKYSLAMRLLDFTRRAWELVTRATTIWIIFGWAFKIGIWRIELIRILIVIYFKSLWIFI